MLQVIFGIAFFPSLLVVGVWKGLRGEESMFFNARAEGKEREEKESCCDNGTGMMKLWG